jgi:acyl transferase domain-containing protein/acyl carrier protein
VGRPEADNALAIIGMSGRFPGAPSIDRFWENLRHGVESITPFSRDELEASGVDPSSFDDPAFVPAGSVLEDVELFDAAFFGFSPREAESLDPQHRLFLETAWHALEDAGHDPATFPGLVGVYGGCAMSSYLDQLQANPELMSLLGYLQVHIGNDKDYLTTRVSHKLDLKGPSFSIQTACSTSLLAVAVAGDHLLNGQCDMALAGGVCVRVPQKEGYYFEPGGIFSPDGHCRVFDQNAEGVVFGNGVGVVVLRRLSDAVADGDAIHAVVKGWAVNNDGAAKGSFAAPSLEGQSDVIARAHAHAGIRADTITYVEAHGTGTSVGDPIEIGALTNTFRASTEKKQFCAVGSVKTNVGHLDPAAGVASLIKTALALEHREIPPSLNCDTLNPSIDFANSPFFVNRELSEWRIDEGPRRAGVSGFGIGGTNVHLVLEEAPALDGGRSLRRHHLAVLSARSASALQSSATNLAEHLLINPDLDAADVAHTLQVGRRAMEHRCAVVYENVDDLVAALAASDRGRLELAAGPPRERSVAFMFSGQGAQYVNMGLGLYEHEPTFRAALDRCAERLEPTLGVDLRTLIYPAGHGEEAAQAALTETAITQPALFAVEYAMARLWMDRGVYPDAMIGHSIGEFVAACLAGVFSLEDGLALVAERGRLMQAVPHGSMVAVYLPEAELRASLPPELDLAAANEANLCVVSGPTAEVESFEARLAVDDVPFQRLHTSHAFHSRMMDGVVGPFAEKVGRLSLSPPRIPYVSNLTGEWITAEEATSPDYWARQLRRSVRFGDGLRPILANPASILLEVGPGQTLCSFARRHPDRQDTQLVLPSLRRPQESGADDALSLESLGRMWLAGVPVDWSGVHAGERRRRVHLPVYPFERRRYWADDDEPALDAAPIVLKEPAIRDWFYAPTWEYALDPKPPQRPGEASRWLLFDDGRGLGRDVASLLAAGGHDVTVVSAGEGFASDGPTFTIEPGRRSDYDLLFQSLAENDRLPQNILHLWCVGEPEPTLAEAELTEHWQERGFYSLLYVVQALLAQSAVSPVQLVAASTGLHRVTGDERVSAAKAPLLGVCRAVPQQYPHIACRSVDIEPAEADGDRTGAQLVAEFSDDELRPTVAYRNGQRWLQAFEPLQLDRAPSGHSPLRWHGVYLITGGLGNIGLTIAEELAYAAHARLVLVGRSTMPARDEWDAWLASHAEDDRAGRLIGRVRELEDLGAEVLLVQADVADENAMRAALDATHARFGRLDGVIHGAGNVTADGFFSVDEADYELCERQFRTKIRGLITLERVLRDESLDLVVLLSSISSALAGLGYVAYGAGNAFMDAFAHEHSGEGGVPWISIDWDTWEFPSGDGTPTEAVPLSMNPDEGVEAFRRIVSSVSLPQLVVSTGYLPDRIEQWVDLRSLRDGMEVRQRQAERFHSRPELGPVHVPPRTPLEEAIVEVWEDVLGLRPVGVVDNFFTDLGGDSLLATQLISRLRSRFGMDIPLRAFFDGSTVVELADVIGSRPDGELARSSGETDGGDR